MDDHQLIIRGQRRRGQTSLVCLVGEQVPKGSAGLVRHLFLEPYTSAWAPPGPARPSLEEELSLRGYDLATLRLSLHLKGHGTPRKPRVLPARPGLLLMRWGWLDYDHSPDLSTSWYIPCSRADSSLLMSRLSQPAMARSADESFRGDSGWRQLENAGWDLRTLDFRVRHMGWLYRPDWRGRSPGDPC